mmetsp:Transcript_18213/g.48928  ORF Transcript_18213/g.48928 Transcript_18213/m.48928 type:complete len:105 (-) Transcript_18213:927-1241(-)
MPPATSFTCKPELNERTTEVMNVNERKPQGDSGLHPICPYEETRHRKTHDDHCNGRQVKPRPLEGDRDLALIRACAAQSASPLGTSSGNHLLHVWEETRTAHLC